MLAMGLLLAFTQGLVTVAVLAGFVIGAFALILVNRDVTMVTHKVDDQEHRIDVIEGLLARMEERERSDYG